jgi:uncharacterized protein YdeI (YjbR/CyaY-like superfamily)
MPEAPARSFRAGLEPDNTRLNWTIVRIPFDVAKVWGARGRLRVKGEINGFTFRTALFPDGRSGHYLLVNKQMQKGGHVSAGASAQFKLEPDTARREIAVSAELERALSEDRALLRWFRGLSESMRNEAAKWVAGVKSAEARGRRAMQLAERLLATMEGEKELPPVLRLAFDRNPRAFAGWKLMSPVRRRGHLLGIFYYRDPKSQARRAQKAVKDAFALTEKRTSDASEAAAPGTSSASDNAKLYDRGRS